MQPMRLDLVLAVVCLSAILAAPAAAQDQQNQIVRPIVPFLEGTDVFASSNRDVRFEAAIFPHLVGWQNFDTLLNARVKASDRRYFWVFSGTPAVRLRMFESESAPVRTPSYMPRGSVQMIYSADYRCGAAGQVRKQQAGPVECEASKEHRRPSVSLWEYHLIVGHHSNGQDGCLYDEQDRPPSGGRCQPSYADAPAPGTINRIDGSFSTNYVRGGFNWRRNYLGTETENVAETVREFTLGAEYQRQFHTDIDQRPFYAMNRAIVSASAAQAQMVKFCKARFSESGGATMQIDHPVDAVQRVTLWAQLSCFPQIKGGWGFFVRGHSGQDYYNLGFLENINQIHVGVTFNQDGFFKFRSPR